jgi:hypothetical protein
VTQHLKAGTAEPEETAVAMHRLGKHLPAPTNREELLDAGRICNIITVLANATV